MEAKKQRKLVHVAFLPFGVFVITYWLAYGGFMFYDHLVSTGYVDARKKEFAEMVDGWMMERDETRFSKEFLKGDEAKQKEMIDGIFKEKRDNVRQRCCFLREFDKFYILNAEHVRSKSEFNGMMELDTGYTMTITIGITGTEGSLEEMKCLDNWLSFFKSHAKDWIRSEAGIEYMGRLEAEYNDYVAEKIKEREQNAIEVRNTKEGGES